jgi:hypothetical protein
MNVVIFGATGMVGHGALLECIDDPRVKSILVIGRMTVGVSHPKVEEILMSNFRDYRAIQNRFADRDACLFCLGVSAAGMKEDKYRALTFDVTMAAADAMVSANPNMTICYVSGQGTDSSEQGSVMWARVKGQTENALLRLRFKAAYMFRPGVIQPMRGVKSKTPLYNVFYVLLGPLVKIARGFFPKHITTTEAVGRALIEVSLHGHPKQILETEDINRVAASSSR